MARKEWGSWPGAGEKNRGSHLTSVLLRHCIERGTVYRFPPERPLRRPPVARRLCSRLHRVAASRGNLMEEGMGVPAGGRSMRIGPSLHIGSGQAHRAVVGL